MRYKTQELSIGTAPDKFHIWQVPNDGLIVIVFGGPDYQKVRYDVTILAVGAEPGAVRAALKEPGDGSAVTLPILAGQKIQGFATIPANAGVGIHYYAFVNSLDEDARATRIFP